MSFKLRADMCALETRIKNLEASLRLANRLSSLEGRIKKLEEKKRPGRPRKNG